MSDSLQPRGLYSPWNSPGQNTGVGRLSLLPGIFPTQGSNPGLPHCRQILYQLSHKGTQEYWSWQPIPSSADLPDPGIELGSPVLQADSLPAELSGKPVVVINGFKSNQAPIKINKLIFFKSSSFPHRIKLRVFPKSDLAFLDNRIFPHKYMIKLSYIQQILSTFCFPGILKGVCVFWGSNILAWSLLF